MSMTHLGSKSADAETSLDLAEELFVSCRFIEAANICIDYLMSLAPPASAVPVPGGNRPADQAQIAFLGDHLSIALLGECTAADLLIVILLQCGYELRRPDDWAHCCRFYGEGRSVPFPVALLWLRLQLASGEVESVRKLLQLREKLSEELERVKSGVEVPYSQECESTARANYTETMEVLVIQAMLPYGERVEAASLLSRDAHLAHEDQAKLLQWCTSSNRKGDNEGCTSAVMEGSSPAQLGTLQRSIRGDAACTQHNDDTSSAHRRSEIQQTRQSAIRKLLFAVPDWAAQRRTLLFVGAGVAALATGAIVRRRQYLWRTVCAATGLATRAAGDVGCFIVGVS